MTETELLGEVLDLAKKHDVLAFHAYDSTTTTGAGFPDLVLAGSKRLLLAELKSATGSTTSAQTRWKWRVLNALGPDGYVLWTPRHLNAGIIEMALMDLSQPQEAA